MRKRRILFAGFVATRILGEERLPRRVMFGELVGAKGYSEGQEKGWMARPEEGMLAFGNEFERWRKAARKAGRWFRQVEEWAKSFMLKWHDAESCCRAAGSHYIPTLLYATCMCVRYTCLYRTCSCVDRGSATHRRYLYAAGKGGEGREGEGKASCPRD